MDIQTVFIKSEPQDECLNGSNRFQHDTSQNINKIANPIKVEVNSDTDKLTKCYDNEETQEIATSIICKTEPEYFVYSRETDSEYSKLLIEDVSNEDSKVNILKTESINHYENTGVIIKQEKLDLDLITECSYDEPASACSKMNLEDIFQEDNKVDILKLKKLLNQDENCSDNIKQTEQTIKVKNQATQFNKSPKTSTERGREFRARRKLHQQYNKQQQQIADPSQIETYNTAIMRRRAKNKVKLPKKPPKTAVQRMREYRERKKLLNKVPKTSTERAREFIARKALLTQQSTQQQPADPFEENPISDPSQMDISAEATMRWREENKDNLPKKQPKSAVQRMREYRERKKLGRKKMIKQSIEQLHDGPSEEVRIAYPSQIEVSAVTTSEWREKTKDKLPKKQPKSAVQRMREYRERKKLTSLLETIGHIVFEHGNDRVEIDVENNATDDRENPTNVSEFRSNKAPKTSSERGREFRARKALLTQQSTQLQSAGPSDENQAEDPLEINIIKTLSDATEGLCESSKKHAKSAAERMREYRKRKKLAKIVQLEQQDQQQNFKYIDSASITQFECAGPSKSAEFTTGENEKDGELGELLNQLAKTRDRSSIAS